MGINCGNCIITKPMMRSELLQGKKDGTFANIWDQWENDMEIRKSQKAIGWNDEFVRYLDHIVQIDISHDAPAEQRGRYSNLVNRRGIEANMQGMPFIKRPVYKEAKIAITEVQHQPRHVPTER